MLSIKALLDHFYGRFTKQVNAYAPQNDSSLDDLATKMLTAVKAISTTPATRPSLFMSCLHRASRYPVWFAVFVALGCLAIAAWFLPAPRHEWGIFELPKLPNDYGHAAYFGTIWTVQATLIALVYPIVLTFVPILLQRKASSKFALSFYLRDSAVLPAGLSSLLLLAVMTLQYLCAQYIPKNFFLFGVVLNGTWLIINLTLTGVFLVRTVQYVEEEAGEVVYLKHAVHYTLWQDLRRALVSSLYRSRSQPIGTYRAADGSPYASPYPGRAQQTVAKTFLRKEKVLVDVKLSAIRKVMQDWHQRALSFPAKNLKSPADGKHQPTLEIIPRLGLRFSGEVALAKLLDGPPLLPAERTALSNAFVFGQTKTAFVRGTTKDLLEELAAEVQSQLEQNRFAASDAAFKKLFALHLAFLHASAPLQTVTVTASIASLGAYWDLDNTSINESWLDTYDGLAETAISQIPRNQDIWRHLTGLTSSLTMRAEIKEPEIISQFLRHFITLDHLLSGWWQKEHQKTGTAPSVAGATLPEPLASDYNKAVVALVNGFVRFPNHRDSKMVEDVDAWDEHKRVTGIWLSHLTLCMRLTLNAVRRGDVAASQWYTDALLHWMSDRLYQYEGSQYEDFFWGEPAVDLETTSFEWPEFKQYLQRAGRPDATVAEAVTQLRMALRWHWDCVRMTCALLAIEDARDEGHPALGGVIAHRLSSLKFFGAGLHADGMTFDTADNLLSLYLKVATSKSGIATRLGHVIQEVRRNRGPRTAIVGWGYSGFGSSEDIYGQAGQMLIFLLALENSGSSVYSETQRVVDDAELATLRKLRQTLQICLAHFSKASRRRLAEDAWRVREAVGRAGVSYRLLAQTRRKLTQLLDSIEIKIAKTIDNIQVTSDQVHEFMTALQAELTAPSNTSNYKHIPTRVIAAKNGGGFHSEFTYFLMRETFTNDLSPNFDKALVCEFSRKLVERGLDSAVLRLISNHGLTPVTGSSADEQLTNLVEAIESVRETSKEPLILAPRYSPRRAIDPATWRRGGMVKPPPGVDLTYHNSAKSWFSERVVNGVSVLDIALPDGHFYVVPREWFGYLVLEADDSKGSLAHTFESRAGGQLKVLISYNSWLSPQGST